MTNYKGGNDHLFKECFECQVRYDVMIIEEDELVPMGTKRSYYSNYINFNDNLWIGSYGVETETENFVAESTIWNYELYEDAA